MIFQIFILIMGKLGIYLFIFNDLVCKLKEIIIFIVPNTLKLYKLIGIIYKLILLFFNYNL